MDSAGATGSGDSSYVSYVVVLSGVVVSALTLMAVWWKIRSTSVPSPTPVRSLTNSNEYPLTPLLGIRDRNHLKLLLNDPKFEFIEKILNRGGRGSGGRGGGGGGVSKELLEAAVQAMDFEVLFDYIKKCIEMDLKASKDESTLFRQRTPSAALWTAYSTKIGQHYLQTTFKDEIEKLQLADENIEVVPHRVSNPSELEESRQKLTITFNKFFDSLIESKNHIPIPLRRILSFLYERVKENYTPNFAEISIGSFFFLRFICPALLIPHTYGIGKDLADTRAQRTLIFISKMLQNLANFNDQVFWKEDYMLHFKPLLKEKREKFENFIAFLVKPADDQLREYPSTKNQDLHLQELEIELALSWKIENNK